MPTVRHCSGTPLGDILLAAASEDPGTAGHLIGQTITLSRLPEAGAKLPVPKAEREPHTKFGAPATPTQYAAE